MRPTTFGYFGDQSNIVMGPVARACAVDRHHRRKPILFNQWHADCCGNADRCKAGRLILPKLGDRVTGHKRNAASLRLRCHDAEIIEAIGADDACCTRRRPIATNVEYIVVSINISIRADIDAEMFAKQPGGGRHHRFGIGLRLHCLGQHIQETEAGIAFARCCLSKHPLRGFGTGAEHSCNCATLVAKR